MLIKDIIFNPDAPLSVVAFSSTIPLSSIASIEELETTKKEIETN